MQPIAPATTTTTAFLGALSDGGAPYEAQHITSALPGTSRCAVAVSQFFLGGARDAWIVPVPEEDVDLPRALAALDAIPSLNIVAMPDLATLTGLAHSHAVASIASYCANRRAFCIIDPPADWNDVDTVTEQIGELTSVRENGAIYWPLLLDGTPAPMPPSGAVAAVYVTCDESRGVWSPPAGVNAPLAAVKPAVTISDAQNGTLNSIAVNAIRALPVYGTVLWGARTLAGADVLGSQYRYISVRRLALFIESSITDGLQWTVFEPNDLRLWSTVSACVSDFLTGLWRAGALIGNTPDSAFYVRCDSTTMTPDDIANGQIYVDVGFAPIHPAEFITLQIGARALTP
jgi:phage tail sheath protein FI